MFYYDERGRVVQTKSSNHLSEGIDKEYFSYNFVGQPLKRKHIHSAKGKTTQTELYVYGYDHTGPLLTSVHQLNNGKSVILVDNEYDELGRLKSNKRNGQSQLKTNYSYNIRSWTKNITGSLFTQTLYYNDGRPNGTNLASYNGNHQTVEYAYDCNGNQIKDLNKGISKIEHNLLNLPSKITFSGSNNPLNEYVYSADGKKMAVIHNSSAEKRTDYIGSLIYENGSLKRILVDGGYIEEGVYYYNLIDHLGNNRVIAKADGTVIQTTHYYPFGMSFAESTNVDKQPYKYNGKELDTDG